MYVYWKDHLVEDHFLRHGVTPEEAEEILEKFPARRSGKSKGNRWTVMGQTSSGRYLIIIIEKESEEVIVPITGIEMNDKQKKAYRRGM